jgi:hypothetical protein
MGQGTGVPTLVRNGPECRLGQRQVPISRIIGMWLFAPALALASNHARELKPTEKSKWGNPATRSLRKVLKSSPWARHPGRGYRRDLCFRESAGDPSLRIRKSCRPGRQVLDDLNHSSLESDQGPVRNKQQLNPAYSPHDTNRTLRGRVRARFFRKVLRVCKRAKNAGESSLS